MLNGESEQTTRDYDLTVAAAQQERTWGIPTLPVWDGKSGTGIIVASGSPRNGRLGLEIKSHQLFAQLSLSKAAQLIEESPSSDTRVRDVILGYRERRRSWTPGGDGGLALEKARLVLAAVMKYLIETNGVSGRLVVIGRDYNVATLDGRFYDKPGYVLSADTNPDILMGKGLGSWVIEGTDNDPIGPVEQFAALYRYGDGPIVTANSVALLSTNLKDWSSDQITQLADVQKQLPEGVASSLAVSYMAIQALGASSLTNKIIKAYASSPMDAIGYLLYQIPGVVDLSRAPFREKLRVWRGDYGQRIVNNFWQLSRDIHTNSGSWEAFPSGRSEEENELVGNPTQSIGLILRGLQ